MPIYTFLDLFAGAGGFTEGMLLASSDTGCFQLVAASDIHPNASLTHQNRFCKQLGINYSFLVEDISSDSFVKNITEQISSRIGEASIDVIVGGPPCQGFSVFGKRNEDDPRNDLFISYLKVIESLKPEYFVMENVPGLASMYGGKTVQKIHEEVSRMKSIKYGVNGPIQVNAADFGVPQLRERILFIGHREDMPPITKLTSHFIKKRIIVKRLR
jgi:DNA (cytosine-5)-methyltransferase 1